jgi:hypothetical protein
VLWVGKRWSVKKRVHFAEGRSGDVGVANVLSVSVLGGDKMARTASHPSSRGVHDGSMCLPPPSVCRAWTHSSSHLLPSSSVKKHMQRPDAVYSGRRVTIATGYGLDAPGSILYNVQTGSGAHPAS